MSIIASEHRPKNQTVDPVPSTIGRMLRVYWPVWLPLVLLVTASVAVDFLNLDLGLANGFWSDTQGWWFSEIQWGKWLYRWSNWPALSVGGIGLIIGLLSLRIPRLRPFRRSGYFLIIVLLLGPGLVVNTAFKSHYGRPRPRQVREFGGTRTFQPWYCPTSDPGAHSFPSGHASMGFYWLAPAILCWRSRRKWAWVLVGLALVHGGTVGFVRMAQGGHWLSDVLWSAGFVYFTALAVHAALPRAELN